MIIWGVFMQTQRASLLFCIHFLMSSIGSAASTSTVASETTSSIAITTSLAASDSTPALPEPTVRGIHLTASAAGSKRYRKNQLEPLLEHSIINAVIVDIKEEDGYVYIPGVKMAEEAKAYARDIPDLVEWLAEMKKRHIYTIGRIVTFKDNKAPRRFPKMGVHKLDGTLWEDRKNLTWMDPYNQQAWRYDLLVALQAAKLGFDEIQFDYIRFPTDGNLKVMRFLKPYSPQAASQALVEFLRQAAQLLHPLGTKISIDVFGLTTSVNTGMGIGQKLSAMAEPIDFVCPMTYPSHYAPGEYGIPIPNNQPYKVIHLAMHDALRVLGPTGAHKLRPYLQDFSMKKRGIRYGPKEVREQIQAAADLGVMSWSLWNASCKYTKEALATPIIPHPTTAPAPAVSSAPISVSSSVDVSTVSK